MNFIYLYVIIDNCFEKRKIMLTLENFKNEMSQYHNDICIISDIELCRLIGIAETEEDFYYIIKDLRGNKIYSSAVGWCVSLKNTYPEKHYARLENIFTINGSVPEKEFIIEKL